MNIIVGEKFPDLTGLSKEEIGMFLENNSDASSEGEVVQIPLSEQEIKEQKEMFEKCLTDKEEENIFITKLNNDIQFYKNLHPSNSVEQVSDGYHTFGELYEYRLMYNALLFNQWAKMKPKLKGVDIPGGLLGGGEFSVSPVNGPCLYDVHKSWKHHDGEWCFGNEKEYFIVVAILPSGQISNHYKAEYWDKFKIPETPKAKYPFDGHTPKDVLERMKSLL